MHPFHQSQRLLIETYLIIFIIVIILFGFCSVRSDISILATKHKRWNQRLSKSIQGEAENTGKTYQFLFNLSQFFSLPIVENERINFTYRRSLKGSQRRITNSQPIINKCIPQRPQAKTEKQYCCDVMSPLARKLQTYDCKPSTKTVLNGSIFWRMVDDYSKLNEQINCHPSRGGKFNQLTRLGAAIPTTADSMVMT